MAKGVKKIKKLSNSSISGDYYKSGDIICINPNQEASFVVGEWYNETTEEERRNINWLWMDQNKIEKFKETRKPEGEPYGITLPKKLCGIYAYYLETSLYGGHNPRNTGVYVFGKCEKKITSASWSKKRNAADNSQINYGQDLFITLETEGLNGDTLKLELYSQKGSKLIDSVKEKCVDGIFKGKFKIKSFNKEFPGLPETSENFYIKVIDFEKSYIKNVSGNDKILSFNVIQIGSIITIPVFEIPTNTAPLIIDDTPRVEELKTEGIITAYFAKEEFTKETAEVDGKHEYKFANANIKYDKNKIAGIIKSKVDALVKADKKYAKFDDIKNALAEESYAKDTTITFNLCKLGAEYKKINSAPLEEEVYVIAKTFLLDGKEVTITIKEKEAIVVDTDVAVPVLESNENGEELTILKATVENGIAKVKVKLRPKADEDLKIWKEKLLKGKKEEAYTYTFKSKKTTIEDNNKKELAAIILKNAKEGKQGNTKIATGKTAFADDVEKALVSQDYISGDTISFDTYKTLPENLWLKAECQGETIKHEGEFLKIDGGYFVIGKKCESEARVRAYMRMLRVGEGTVGDIGYTTRFGGTFSDMSTHPQIIEHRGKYYSSAAGAYQIMGYNYKWLNGEQLDENNMPTGVYEAYHDYIKKYKIPDYSQISQDKLCIIIMKHKRNGILDLIIKDKIEEATEIYGSYEWASLPPGRYGQPVHLKTLKDARDKYQEYLKEELNGKSDLYIKDGFLKEFGYDCCNEESSIGCEGKENIDLRNDNSKWQTQYDSKYGTKAQQDVACWKACKDVLSNFNVEGGNLENNKALYQIASESNNNLVIDSEIAKKGIKYLDEQLENDKPILVGVDHTYKYKGGFNNDLTTDHFIVIIGRGCDNNKPYYLFYDVGTSYIDKGSSDENRLYVKDDYSLHGSTKYTSKHTYTVSQIRKNK
jgi:muramidase (phage lysozyme)